MPADPTRTCATCTHWDPQAGALSGVCRRFPPHPSPYSRNARQSLPLLPLTTAADWCGEWKRA